MHRLVAGFRTLPGGHGFNCLRHRPVLGLRALPGGQGFGACVGASTGTGTGTDAAAADACATLNTGMLLTVGLGPDTFVIT